MKKISFFGLVLAFIAMAIFIVSCSQPLFPDGSSYRPGSSNSDDDQTGGDIPDWETDGSGPCGRMTVAEQLEWLRNNALANTVWYVWAWMEAPYETIHFMQDIHGVGGLETPITVFLRTHSSSTNRLRLLLGASSCMTMLNVQNDNSLILENIVLRGRISSSSPLVVVNAGRLEQWNNSEINNVIHFGFFPQGAVSVREGATFIMSGNALITGNSTVGVSVSNGAVLEMEGDARITNNSIGVSLQGDSALIMRGNTHISGHEYEGVRSQLSRIYMHNEAQIWDNGDSGDNAGVLLGNSYLIMYNKAKIHSNKFGGGVFAGNESTIRMYDEASIHSNINLNANGGGGVTLSFSSLYMHDYSVTIRGNSSENSQGGGVRLESNSTLTIHRGLIYGIDGNGDFNDANKNNSLGPPNGHALYIVDTWAAGTLYYGVVPMPVPMSTPPDNFRNQTFGVQGGVLIDNG